MKAPQFNPAAPEDLQLDLLVDDELPETERARVLRAIDAAPGGWRTLAIRFMQRQVERSAIRQFMQQRPAHRAGTGYFPVRTVHQLRIAAAFVLTAGIAAAAALYYSAEHTGTPGLVSSGGAPAMFNLSSEALGLSSTEARIDVPVSVRNPATPPDLGRMVRDVSTDRAGSRHVVIAPHGANGAVVFPVTTVNQEVVY